MPTSQRKSNKRKIFRKVAELKEQLINPVGVVDLVAVKLSLQNWGQGEPWITGEAWSDWAERQVVGEDEETHYRSSPAVMTDQPRFDFWYTENRNTYLKITEGKLGERIKVSSANGDHWRLWRTIRTDNLERLRLSTAADVTLADEMIRQFNVRPHCQTTEEIMREGFGWKEPEPETAGAA
jgi:hypothetical protein